MAQRGAGPSIPHRRRTDVDLYGIVRRVCGAQAGGAQIRVGFRGFYRARLLAALPHLSHIRIKLAATSTEPAFLCAGPLGPREPGAPPCIRQRLLPVTAGD